MAEYRVKKEIERYNAIREEPTDGIDCPKCLNRGRICVRDTDYIGLPSTRYIRCDCMDARNNMRRIKASGLEDELDRCTFDSFVTEQPFQQGIKQKAMDYLQTESSEWLFMGGQVGSGKTHLCTAVCGVFLKEKHIPVKYMLWKDESTRLKMLINTDEYAEEINKFKTVPVLYIDDLFKKQRGKDHISMPSEADVNLAFEIINSRYMDRSKRTIISCEWLLDDLMSFDEATASRIYERAKKYWVEIKRDVSKNYRIRRKA